MIMHVVGATYQWRCFLTDPTPSCLASGAADLSLLGPGYTD